MTRLTKGSIANLTLRACLVIIAALAVGLYFSLGALGMMEIVNGSRTFGLNLRDISNALNLIVFFPGLAPLAMVLYLTNFLRGAIYNFIGIFSIPIIAVIHYIFVGFAGHAEPQLGLLICLLELLFFSIVIYCFHRFAIGVVHE